MLFPLSTLTLLTGYATASQPQRLWPSPQLDALDAARFDQSGFNGNFLMVFTGLDRCDNFLFGGGSTGRSNAADWIRTAYHDMATHNVTDGTGGLDASIRFTAEKSRPENAGDGFNNTFQVLSSVANRYVGFADSLAVAAVLAIENCGGPEIAFRGGRIDAGEPNAPGVPQPQEDLETHIAAFTRQGFTPTEMIGLVACGHTFGGVQHTFFPDIVDELNDPEDMEDVAHFDSTSVNFDNNVAKEYISGSTQNPLVVGFNDTTNSDKRIFGSDGNVTMNSLASSPSLYASTCADLFARMLDTVPHGVQLTDVITPLPVKPANVEFTMANDTMLLGGQVRFWNHTEETAGTVQMLWDDQLGAIGNTTLGFAGAGSATGGKYTSAWYGFDPTGSPFASLSLDPAAGIQRLRFVIDGKLEDQGGVGFAVQDAYMFSESSCLYNSSVSPEGDVTASGRVDIAVRNGVNLTRVYLETVTQDGEGRIVIVEIDIPRPEQRIAVNSAYSLWSLNTTSVDEFTIGAEIDGQTYSTTQLRSVLDSDFLPCGV
ncbi:heme peroxidase [Roridomyces roridus]|uniref:Peroxidase n=1 Tax=Roridomyces roridus TaxID=1738132 RepID=A0AAD7B9U6_9AGAR|nr:heme peroxidase [Roridomyces roridus]